MIILIGLGNPGEKYERNRHNIGFILLDYIADEFKGSWSNNPKLQSDIAKVNADGTELLLIKPQTFMNLSGIAVTKVLNYYKSPISDIRVIYDDKDIPLGNIRTRKDGRAGGHNGIKDIIQQLNTDQFPRVRIGIGKEFMGDAKRYVLSNLSKEEINTIKQVFDKAWHNIIDNNITETTYSLDNA